MNDSIAVFWGILIGVAVGLGFIAILFRKKILSMQFDERQEHARGIAFKYGFFTMLICTYAYGLSELIAGHWCDALAGISICCGISLTVFAVICILKDAYLSLRERPRQIMTMFAILGIINLTIGGIALANGELVENGILTFRILNPVLGLATLIILIIYLINYLLGQREDAE